MMRLRVKSRIVDGLGEEDWPVGMRVWDVDLVEFGYGRGAGETIIVGTAGDWRTAMEYGWTAYRFANVSWRNDRRGQGVHDVHMPQPERRPREPSCHAGRDGECTWERCPQLRDGEPEHSGRHCPLDEVRPR